MYLLVLIVYVILCLVCFDVRLYALYEKSILLGFEILLYRINACSSDLLEAILQAVLTLIL